MAPWNVVGRTGDDGRGAGTHARRGRFRVGLLAATVVMVTLAGCGEDDGATANPQTADETATATASGTTVQTTAPTPSRTTAEETTTPPASATTPDETLTCEHRDGYALSYPPDWQTYPDAEDPDLGHLACGIFGTAPMELEPATSMPWLPIRVWVWEGLPFKTATQPEFRLGENPSRDLKTQDSSVAGRPAVRVVSVSEAPEEAFPSDYYLPRGTESVWWIVDLSTSGVDRVLLGRAIPPAAAFTGVTEADKTSEGATSVDSTAKVLDAMMASLTLTD